MEKNPPREVRRKVYLSGPITGHPDYQATFAEAEDSLVQQGYEVMNPAKLDDPNNPPPWEECIIRDLGFVLGCEVVALLPGWEESAGARLEVLFALRLGKKFMVLPGAGIQITIRLSLVLSEDDLPWGNEDDLDDDEKGFNDFGKMDDIPGWEQ